LDPVSGALHSRVGAGVEKGGGITINEGRKKWLM